MKKIITMAAVALLAFSGNSLFAQAGESKIGFKAGANLANIHGDDAADNKMKVGFHIGGFVTVPLGNLAFQPELLVSTRGYKADSGDVSVNLMYLDIPLLLKFYVSDNINIHLGPQVGLNLSAKYKFGDDSKDIDNFNALDIGALAGLEYDTDFGFVIGARYYYGMTKLNKDYKQETTIGGVTRTAEVDAADVKNNMIQVYVGIGF